MIKKKKILIALGAVIVTVAGVAAMSAYEAHVINVTAHIENALSVDTTPIEFGTVFPQEYIEEQFTINLSTSFLEEDRVDDVEYVIKQKPKPIWPIPEICDYYPGEFTIEDMRTYCHNSPEDLTCCYPSLCPYLSKMDGDPDDHNDIGVLSYWQETECITPDPEYAVGRLAESELDTSDLWIVDLKVPPVEGYVGQDWPVGCPTVKQDSQNYGCDLWIEVTRISETSHGSECEPGAVYPCNTGLLGVCEIGTKTCDQSGYWGPCSGPEPTSEICDDDLDNDCDDLTDCDDADCLEYPACNPGPTPECEPEATESCSTGLLGICAAGTQTCDPSGFWGTCEQINQPTEEICDDYLDNDCDGLTDYDDADCTYPEPISTDTGWKSPAATGGTHNQWDNSTDAYSSNDAYASVGIINYEQDYYNFSISLPSGVTINGIEVSSEAYCTNVKTAYIRLYSASAGSESSDTGEDWPTSEATVTYGGSSDLWGLTWQVSDFSNANFYVVVKAGQTDNSYFLDHIQVKVYYTE